ncbi:MAG: hypothetical protein KA792_05595, partial [Bacteroidales bacterium]|nr:hypothetical protein [Bacteroidales bacterium]
MKNIFFLFMFLFLLAVSTVNADDSLSKKAPTFHKYFLFTALDSNFVPELIDLVDPNLSTFHIYDPAYQKDIFSSNMGNT